jgi:hypothetical protein
MQIHDQAKMGELRGITPEALAMLGAPSIVYVRPVSAEELRDIPGAPEGADLYSVHAADGTRMAVVASRAAAFMAARENEMVPVSVH